MSLDPKDLEALHNYLEERSKEFHDKAVAALASLPGHWKVEVDHRNMLHLYMEDRADNRISALVYVELNLDAANKQQPSPSTDLDRGKQIIACVKVKSNINTPGLNLNAVDAMLYHGRVTQVALITHGLTAVIEKDLLDGACRIATAATALKAAEVS